MNQATEKQDFQFNVRINCLYRLGTALFDLSNKPGAAVRDICQICAWNRGISGQYQPDTRHTREHVDQTGRALGGWVSHVDVFTRLSIKKTFSKDT